jgi:para-aminobenzoate synthetase component I
VWFPPDAVHATREIAAGDPLALLAKLRGRGGAWLLESALPDARLGRWHLLGADPWCIARVRGDEILVERLRTPDGAPCLELHRERGEAFAALRALLPRNAVSQGDGPPFPFAGGLAGWLGYELGAQQHGVPRRGRDDLGLPDALFFGVDRCIAIERESGRTFLSALGFGDDAATARDRAHAGLDALASALAVPAAEPPRVQPTPARALAPDLDAGAYAKAVDAVLEEIAAGNVYQACFTQRCERAFAGDPLALYAALRRINPAPFAAFFEAPEAALVGSSPERFLGVTRHGQVETRPIKGTRPRGATPEDDARLRAELLASPKERAENVMIVDLARNDLGRVCATGSVHVPELYAVEEYASVFQLVSTVRGQLAPGRDAFDAARAAFPPGSMTGAPKRAAMSLLDRLEIWRRGIYSGAAGYFDVFGGADLSVVIRSAIVSGGRALLHAGGGVVADSLPFAEHAEAQQKLAPLLRALDEIG